MKTSRLIAIALAAGLAGTTLLSTLPASADSRLRQEEVRQLRESGKILSMEEILARARKTQPGQVVEVELEQDDDSGRWVYEIKLLQAGGRLVKLKVDAATGQVLRRKDRSRKGDRHP